MRWLALAVLIGLTWNHPVSAAEAPGRIAFVRDGGLWLWEAGQERPLPAGEERVHHPRFSADGRFLLYSQPHRLSVMELQGGGRWELPAEHCDWAPVGHQVACDSPQGVYLLNVGDQGPSGVLLAFPGWHGAAWAPDGEHLALVQAVPGKEPLSGTTLIGVAEPGDEQPKVIWQETYHHDLTKGAFGPAGQLRWSADGRWLSFVRHGPTSSIAADMNELAVLPAAGGRPVTLGEMPGNPAFYAWSPTDVALAFTDGAGRTVWHDKQVRVVTMPPKRPFRSITPKGYADREPAWAPAGERLAVSRSRAAQPNRMDRPAAEQGIYLVDLPTGRAEKVPGSDGGVGPNWGCDGSLLWVKPQGEGKPAALWWRPDLKSSARELIKDVGITTQYYGQWHWRQAFDWWTPGP